MEIVVCDSPEAIAEAAAGIFWDRFSRKNRLTVAVSGGSTPGPSYRRISVLPLDWSLIDVWWVDDRYVPPTDPNSNEGLLRETWLSNVPIPASNVHSMYRGSSPGDAADLYEREWFARFGDFGGVDLAFMGIGSDGHCASLFPGDEPSLKSARLVLNTKSPVGIRERITLTQRALANSEELLFIATGGEKAKYVAAMRAGTGDWPCCRVARAAEKVTVLVDHPAAGL